MPDGESSTAVADQLSDQGNSFSLSTVKNHDDTVIKDPTKIARKYQLALCKKAMEENIIVYLGTGCGKTHIAVLLMHEMRHLIKKPNKDVCVFLAPTVTLVNQQAKVISDSTDFEVGTCCGSNKRSKSHQHREEEIEQNEVFYKSSSTKVPRIFGMTASPVVGKGASTEANLPKSINSLELILDAKVYTVKDEALKSFVTTAEVNIYHYSSTSNMETSLEWKIEEFKLQCIETLGRSIEDHQKRLSTKKLLNRVHDNVVFCLRSLGIWGALQASRILLSGDRSERHALVEAEGISSDESVCDKYLAKTAELFHSKCDSVSDPSSWEILKEPFFSAKLLRLIGILTTFRLQQNMKCIIFVNRIVTARALSFILRQLQLLRHWKSDFLVGVHSGVKIMSRKAINTIVEKFRSGELNLLVATKVGEEGLDIQTCCLVIRFDLPETVASFIQSRGRARMPHSEYAFLVDSGNEKELDIIAGFEKDEFRMNTEINVRTSSETHSIPVEKTFTVSSGASVSAAYSISLLHQYCSKLPRDEFFDPRPNFFYFDDLGGTVCQITLPSNASIHQIVGTPQLSMEGAKRDACLKAIEELYKLGALNDCLLPRQNDAETEKVLGSSDSDECEDDHSRGELHEMRVPSAFRQSWKNEQRTVRLISYYIKFCPTPDDRVYKKFGLFIMTPLPLEAEKLELDLHLAHGRSVMTKFMPFGVVEFNKDEIKMAENFQEMFLRVILDRLEFVSKFVKLGAESRTSTSTFYLLLPVILKEYDDVMKVDWETVKRCLCSPIFRHPEDTMDKKVTPLDNHLQLANGYRSVRDVENSLVYVPHKKFFYCITNIIYEKNGFSPYKDSDTSSYVDHFNDKYSINLKRPEQPLLHAKQLFNLHNLLHDRKTEDAEKPHELEEYLIYLPPELCELKIVGFSKEIGSSISLLPSIMHRLGNLLVAIELKHQLSSSFPEATEISAHRFLEALTTEKCQERFSLERLEVLGDAFLKFAVARHFFLLHDSFHEGDLTSKRSNVVNNSNLLKLAIRRNLQVYIRDQAFDPLRFYALGRPCPTVCTKENEDNIHLCLTSVDGKSSASATGIRCNKNHHWLHRKTIADVVEALVGAFIVDSGFKAAIAFLAWIGIEVNFEASQLVNICTASVGYFPLSAEVDIPSLEDKLGHHFVHKGLLLQAFVHPSYNKHGGGCYQRLEFLGDAVLDFLITSYLYSAYPKLKPGQLTDLRALSVNNKAFACVAVERCFDGYLLCDSRDLIKAVKKYVNYIRRPGSDSGNDGGPKSPKALGDLVESCVGAILLDSGFDLNKVWKIMTSFLDPIMKFSSSLQLSPVRDLQELCQFNNLDLQLLESKLGKKFSVEVKVIGDSVCEKVCITGQNKKEASRIASQLLFSKLKAQGLKLKSKTLEDVLKSTFKTEPKLIGFDETPIDVTDITTIGQEMVNGDLCNNSNPEIFRICEVSDASSSCVKPVAQRLQSSPKEKLSETSRIRDFGSDSSSDSSKTGNARSRLYELCAAYYWKPPSFECCKEEGPAHLKLFTCKATMEIEEAPNMVFEFTGEPLPKKKDAADSAAEAAFWYLQQEGYLH
ncbi:hypothetical protein TSUD_196120 [Trifolium subterraneum]|nr:hypothetical protein TSUD_196120 [Trifolium subterraneum]